jgi:glycosyltransferase involved in cell wall biosynthesis
MLPAYWRSYGVVQDLVQSNIAVYHGLSNEIPILGKQVKQFKKVVTIHDLIFLKEKQQYSFIDQQIYSAKVKYACKNADVIVATSEETKQDIIRFFQISESKIKVVYQNCDRRFFASYTDAELQAIRQKYGLPDRYVLNVSSFYPRKNQTTLINAFAALKEKTGHHLILIGGHESERKKCEQLVIAHQLSTRVTFLSDISFLDLPLIYKMADLFVNPSFFEGFGIPVVEALASGVRVICSDIPCFREVGASSVDYFNPHDQMELAALMLSVLQNRETRVMDGLIAERFSPQTFAQKMISVYTQ